MSLFIIIYKLILILPNDDHIKAIKTIISFKTLGITGLILTINAARSIGNKQYPKIQILWNKETLDPSKLPLMLIINPPQKTIKKIVTNTIPPSESFPEAIILKNY